MIGELEVGEPIWTSLVACKSHLKGKISLKMAFASHAVTGVAVQFTSELRKYLNEF